MCGSLNNEWRNTSFPTFFKCVSHLRSHSKDKDYFHIFFLPISYSHIIIKDGLDDDSITVFEYTPYSRSHFIPINIFLHTNTIQIILKDKNLKIYVNRISETGKNRN